MLSRMLHAPLRLHAAAPASSRVATFVRRAVAAGECRCGRTLTAAAAGRATGTSTARRSFSGAAAATQPAAAAQRINDMEDGDAPTMQLAASQTSAPHAAAAASAAATDRAAAAAAAPLTSQCARPLVVFDLPGARPYDEVWRWQQRFVRDKVAAERRLKRAHKEAAAASAQLISSADAQQSADELAHPDLAAAATALGNSQTALSAGLADVLLMLEHAPVFTLGRNASLRHLRFPSHVRVRVAERGDLSAAERQNADVADDCDAAAVFELLRVERGGEVTFHGPGQLILYPLLALNPTPIAPSSSSSSAGGLTSAASSASTSPYRADLHWFLRGLESVVMRLLRLYEIDAERIEGASGVWVRMHAEHADESGSTHAATPAAAPGGASSSSLFPSSPLRKICAVGLSCSGWVSMHGCALNVDADLHPFDFIVPCGLDDAAKYGGVTSMSEVIAQRARSSGGGGGDAAEVRLDHALIRRQLLQCFRDEFGLPQPAAVLTEPPVWHTNSDAITTNGQ